MRQEKNLSQLFDEYTKECQFSSRLSADSLRGYKEVFKLFQSVMPQVNIVEFLTTEMMIEFFRIIQTRERRIGNGDIKIGVKVSTVKTYWSKLHSFFEWLRVKSLIIENPLSRLKPPQPTYDDIKILIESDIRKLYSAIALHSKTPFLHRRDTFMVSLLYFTGIRLGEFIALQAHDIDLEKRLLTVRSTTSKSKKQRFIPLHPTLIFHLKDYLFERKKKNYSTSFLIVSDTRDRGLSKFGLKHWVERINQKSGVKFHIHQFRHSFACNLASKNVNAVKIQMLLGHSSLNMTMSYLRSIQTDDLINDIQLLTI